MAHGAPDWFGTTPQGMVHRVADLAELAARLGSPDVFDRRGNVLFMDSFENGQNNWSHGALVGVSNYFNWRWPQPSSCSVRNPVLPWLPWSGYWSKYPSCSPFVRCATGLAGVLP